MSFAETMAATTMVAHEHCTPVCDTIAAGISRDEI
jgi:hypothetical protein